MAANVATEGALIAAARAGDEDAFRHLTDPHVRVLHLHCYRMLGSLHDAEDVVQETLVRAWRHLDAFEGRGGVRSWLYRIATNACLTTVARSKRTPQGPPAVSFPEPNAPDVEVVPLEPYPDVWLEELAERDDPAAKYDLAESVRLAFLSVIQLLPARQRAALLLRDVLGWSASEIADLLATTPAAVNGMLQRARSTLERQRASGRLRRRAASEDAELRLLRRFVDAWNAVDIDGLVSLLAEDALLTMPPAPLVYRGRAAIGEFFATVPAGGELHRIRLLPVRANRCPALAAYVANADDDAYGAYGIMVFQCVEEAIVEITGFAEARLFACFGLPQKQGV